MFHGFGKNTPPGFGFGQEPTLSQGCGNAMVSETATIVKKSALR